MDGARPANPFRPLIWVALSAFLLGFSGYLLVGAGAVARAHGHGVSDREPMATDRAGL